MGLPRGRYGRARARAPSPGIVVVLKGSPGWRCSDRRSGWASLGALSMRGTRSLARVLAELEVEVVPHACLATGAAGPWWVVAVVVVLAWASWPRSPNVCLVVLERAGMVGLASWRG